MKPLVMITQRATTEAIELLASVCDVMRVNARSYYARQELSLHARRAQGLMAVTPERIDDALLVGCTRLRIVACTFRILEHIDIAACTRRGIWVTNVMTRETGKEAEIEAARNILDVLGGDTPRGALNEILQPAA